jgi:hypothetical protein
LFIVCYFFIRSFIVVVVVVAFFFSFFFSLINLEPLVNRRQPAGFRDRHPGFLNLVGGLRSRTLLKLNACTRRSFQEETLDICCWDAEMLQQDI